jgi:hypothetical protein
MVVKTLNAIFVLTLLTIFVSCSQKPGTSQLEISTGFLVANTSFPAGLMLYAEKTDGSKKFSLTLEGSNSKTVDIEKGSWRLSVIGWKGGAAGDPNFDDTNGKACGSVSVNLAKDTESVNIKVDSASCATFDTEFDLKKTWVSSCGVFYSYVQSSNTFTALNLSTPDTFCSSAGASMPMMFRSPFKFFKIVALNTLENTEGFSSSCMSTDTKPSILPVLPSKKFPFVVRLYRDASDCVGNSPYHKPFLFKDGLSSSYNFDSFLSYSFGNNRLVLPSGMTNKGRSPFMNQIPYMLCGTSGSYTDCIGEPALSADVNVSWQPQNSDRTIWRGLRGVNSCPSNLFSLFEKFGAENCSISEGALKANIFRNELVCQDGSVLFPGQTIQHLYQRGDYIYVLSSETGPTYYLHIFNESGKKLTTQNLGSTFYSQVAATKNVNPRIFLLSTGNVAVKDFTFPNSLTTVGNIAVSGLSKIEVNDDGSQLFGVLSSSLKSYQDINNLATWSSPTPNAVNPTLSAGGTVDQITYYGGTLYTLIAANIYKIAVSGGALPASMPSSFGSASAMTHFSFDGNRFFDTFGGGIEARDANWAVISTAATTAATPLGVVDAGLFAFVANPSGIFAANKLVGSTLFNDSADHSGTCTESQNLTVGGSTKTVIFETKKPFDQYPVFNDGYRLLGRQTFTNPDKALTYFDAFSEGDKDEVRTGGNLSRVQDWLSPIGVSGALAEFASCSDVMAAAPFSRTKTFSDPITGESGTAVLNVTGANPTDQFVWNDSDPSGAQIRPNYDLYLDITMSHGDGSEHAILKLSCSGKLGSFESFEMKTNKNDSEKILWNVTADSYGRYEFYSLTYDRLFKKSAEVVQVKKNSPSTLNARKINSEIDFTSGSSVSWANVMEYEINGTHTQTGMLNLNDSTSNLDNTSYDMPAVSGSIFGFDEIRSNSDFGALTSGTYNAPACVNGTPSTLVDAIQPSCAFSSPGWTASSGVPMTIEEIRNDALIEPGANMFGLFELGW